MNASEFQRTLTASGGGYPEGIAGPRIDKIRNIVAGFKDRMRILDIGCADGSILSPFAKLHELHGVEICDSLVQQANAAGVKAVMHDVEAKALPYPDKTFNIVFCGETIEHQVDTDWLMAEINRVLKPGGKAILTFPNIRTVLGLGMLLFLDLPPMYAARYRSPHYRDFTLRTMKIVLGNHGFVFDRAVGSAFYLPRIGEFWSGVATFFPSWAHTVVVVASKAKDSTYAPVNADTMEIY
jgi:SAM-dependent methyltransferase